MKEVVHTNNVRNKILRDVQRRRKHFLNLTSYSCNPSCISLYQISELRKKKKKLQFNDIKMDVTSSTKRHVLIVLTFLYLCFVNKSQGKLD